MRKSTTSNFDHLLKYKSTVKSKVFRSTQIISSIDVKSTEENLLEMISNGMNIACFDCSEDASLSEFEKALKNLRSALKLYNQQRKNAGKIHVGDYGDENSHISDVSVAIALDIKAQSSTTGMLHENQTDYLKVGYTVKITNNQDYFEHCDANWIYINYCKLTELNPHQIIFIDDRIKLMVENVDLNESILNCRILNGGIMSHSQMDVLIPGAKLHFPPINKDFIDFLEFAKRNDIDMIFASINDQFAFETIKCHLRSEGQEYRIALVAKIDTQAAYDNLEKFLEHADGILISRFRMGLNMTSERAIAAQKCIIAKCLKAGIPSIVSSKMLLKREKLHCGEMEDQLNSSVIADIFNSTIDGCDCIMLNSNSIECLQKMQDTILESEQMINYRRWFRDLLTQVSIPSDTSNTIAVSACTSALVSNASAIIVYTINGDIVRLVAKYRPECPLVVVTPNEKTARQCLLFRGVISLFVKDKTDEYRKNVENAIENGLEFLFQTCIFQKYPSTVIAVYAQKEGLWSTNSMRIINVSSRPERLKANELENESEGEGGEYETP